MLLKLRKDDRLERIICGDRFYIPTRYPNGLPGGIPADTYSEADASESIEKANAIIDAVRTAL